MANWLKITSLKFISAVDAGAQGAISNVALWKRAPTGDEFQLTCKVAKLDAALGVVFGYAIASTVDGGKTPHIDLQDDAVLGGDELIKVALGFAEAGAQSDVMHDCVADGWVPFVMPLNAETKKAFGLSGDVEGIAIGMKPSAATFKRFVSGELAAFSIYGTGIREPLEAGKRTPSAVPSSPLGKIVKSALYTDEVDGHQHQICVYDDGSFYVQHATMSGAEYSHSHGIVRGEDGSLEILADSGHKHQLAAGQPSVFIVSPDAVVVVQASAPNTRANKSTRIPAVSQPALTSPEPSTMKTAETLAAELADITKRFERADRIAKMSGAHKTLFDTLTGEDADAFLAKSASDRDAVAKAALEADPIVVELNGQQYRKSAGPAVIELAKTAKAQSELIEKADIEKAATAHLGNFAGDKADHADLIRAVHAYTKGDLEKRAKLLTVLDGANAIAKARTVPAGGDGANSGNTVQDGTPLEALEKGLNKYCADNKIEKVWTVGLAKFKATPEGAELKRAYDEYAAG